jgi:hypothetical protein
MAWSSSPFLIGNSLPKFSPDIGAAETCSRAKLPQMPNRAAEIAVNAGKIGPFISQNCPDSQIASTGPKTDCGQQS